MQRVTEKYGLFGIDNPWIDAIEVMKRTIPEYGEGSYKLQHLAKHFSIQTKAHDALDDASTCALILNKVLADSDTKIEDWLELVKKPVKLASEPHQVIKHAPTPNAGGKFFGKTLVFTGTLINIPRSDAEELAHTVGFVVKGEVTKKTTHLVVGIQDLVATKGKGKSTKEIATDKLICEGVDIAILTEGEFLNICGW